MLIFIFFCKTRKGNQIFTGKVWGQKVKIFHYPLKLPSSQAAKSHAVKSRNPETPKWSNAAYEEKKEKWKEKSSKTQLRNGDIRKWKGAPHRKWETK